MIILNVLGETKEGSEVKAHAWNVGDPGLIPGSGRSPGLPGESHGGRSLVGYSPWGCKELDTTKRLHSLTHSLKEYDDLGLLLLTSAHKMVK